MKKMLGKKVTMGLFCAIMSASMLMGCASTSTSETKATVVAETMESSEEAMTQEAPTEAATEAPTDMPETLENQYMGEISTVDESTITIALYETPSMDQGGMGKGGKKPEGEVPVDGQKPEGGEAPTDGQKPEGEAPADREAKGMTLSGEEMTITITDDTVITKRDGDTEETISLADLAEGDVVSFTVDGENALTISVSNQ